MTQEPLIPAGVDDVLAQKATRGPRTPKPVHPYAAHHNPRAPRAIRATWCRHCGAPTVTGLDADVMAFDTICDTTPLSPLGEAVAKLATPPRGTYTLEAIAGPATITRRTAYIITTLRPAGRKRAAFAWDVLPTHVCGQPIPEALTIPSTIRPPRGTQLPPANPPF